MISFNEPVYLEQGMKNILEAVAVNKRLNGDGVFTGRCKKWIETTFQTPQALMTTSCTHSLEMAAILAGIKEGDEVIMPSYTFVSTANAFVSRGARIKFVDIRPDTLNIDETLIESAITNNTKAIIPVHYAGVACEMDTINKIGKENNIYIIEDAAQGFMAKYKGKYVGVLGDFGCYSFHETKNYTMGEGGAILVNNKKFIERAEVIREKGTNRAQFFRGNISKYTWVDIGSSYLPSEMNVAYLYAQLERAEKINKNRLKTWEVYKSRLSSLEKKGLLELPVIPKECEHNAHMFYIKVKDRKERTKMLDFLRKNDVGAVFHYIPLHSSSAGRMYGEFIGEDKYTTKESERIIRLPMFYELNHDTVEKIAEIIYRFYN